MYLSRLYVENYRSIKKIDLVFRKGKNIIVGKNNSGKSNIIKAIDLILGDSSPTWNKSDNITKNDFYQGNTDNEIFIWCELAKEDREELELSDVKGAFFKIKDKYTQVVKKINVNLSNKDNIFELCSEEGQARLDSNEFKKEWVGTKQYCTTGFQDELNDKEVFAFAFKAKKEGNFFNKEMVFLYKKRSELDWFFAINANLRNELLQSAIIPSFRDPKDQLRIANYTWYGKLLKACVKEEDSDLNEAFGKVKEASDKLFKELQEKICCEKTKIAFPNTKICFQFNPESKQDLFKNALIYVDDGFNSRLDEKGSGIQSALIISLFDYYIRNIAHTSGSLLAIEEPEIYLHPHGRRVISDRLDSFLDDNKNQVIITTHSPEFICSPHENINIIIVKKEVETKAKNFDFSEQKTKQVLIKKQNAEMFFADAVILTEGADKYILESIAEYIGKTIHVKIGEEYKNIGKNWLNDYNISIINCGGKMEFWKYVKIFNDLEIPWIIISDFDFLREGLNDFFTKLSYSQININELNTLKSKITLTGKYKSLSEISTSTVQNEVKSYLLNLLMRDHICILTGELENFYLNKPRFDKEAGVLETISKIMDSNDKNISEYVNINEFVTSLKIFMKECLKLSIRGED